jgi:hypothetical protein
MSGSPKCSLGMVLLDYLVIDSWWFVIVKNGSHNSANV